MAQTSSEKELAQAAEASATSSPMGVEGAEAELINSSGHVQEVDRNFSLLTLAGVGIVLGSTWAPAGASIIVALFNGGPPGVLYEFLVVSFFYWIVAASIAELASAIPSAGGVYHWASVTPGKRYGRVVGFFAGYWNWLAWTLGAASISSIAGNITVQMYAVKHPLFVPKSWHVFVSSIIITWLGALAVCFGNKFMPKLNAFGIFIILAGVFATIVVVTAMPGHDGRPPHATNSFVWSEWQAELGYPNGFVFVAGMLNGAFAVGTPDCVTHLAEEIPRPGHNVPKAIAMQMVIGFFTGFFYLIAIMYAINDYEALFSSPFPIAEIYYQATGSAAGEIGLLFLLFLTIILTVTGVYITAGRVLWTLARDRATPFPNQLGKINTKLGMPFNSTICCACVVTVLLLIYIGSVTAFNAFVGTFILLSTSSYTAAILPNLLTKRKNIIYGPFHMKGMIGFIMNAVACSYMIVWFVIYCFPFYLPTNAATMNYACLIWGGLTVFVIAWWFIGARKGYTGPQTIGGLHSTAEEVKKVEELKAAGRTHSA